MTCRKDLIFNTFNIFLLIVLILALINVKSGFCEKNEAEEELKLKSKSGPILLEKMDKRKFTFQDAQNSQKASPSSISSPFENLKNKILTKGNETVYSLIKSLSSSSAKNNDLFKEVKDKFVGYLGKFNEIKNEGRALFGYNSFMEGAMVPLSFITFAMFLLDIIQRIFPYAGQLQGLQAGQQDFPFITQARRGRTVFGNDALLANILEQALVPSAANLPVTISSQDAAQLAQQAQFSQIQRRMDKAPRYHKRHHHPQHYQQPPPPPGPVYYYN